MHLLLGLAMRQVPAPFSLYIVTACHTHWFAHKSDSEILLLSRNRFGAGSVYNSDFQQYTVHSTQFTVQGTQYQCKVHTTKYAVHSTAYTEVRGSNNISEYVWIYMCEYLFICVLVYLCISVQVYMSTSVSVCLCISELSS